jgi:hypothetical protein
MTLNFPGNTSQPYVDSNTGLKYIFNNSIGAWETALQPPAVVSDVDPNLNIPGFLWWDKVSGTLFVRYLDGNGNEQWVEAVPSGGNQQAMATVSANEPSNPRIGELWVDITDPIAPDLKVYGSWTGVPQWTSLTSTGSPYAGAYAGPRISSGTVAPVSSKSNDIWYNAENKKLYIKVGTEWKIIAGETSVAAAVQQSILTSGALTKSANLLGVRDSKTTQTGVIRLATQAEVNEAKSTTTAVTPGKLKQAVINFLPVASQEKEGVIKIAKVTELDTTSTIAVSPVFVRHRINQAVPIGSIILYVGTTLDNYLLCDGRVVDGRVYQELYYAMNGTNNEIKLPALRSPGDNVQYFIRANK